jgi:hypothetical protein
MRICTSTLGRVAVAVAAALGGPAVSQAQTGLNVGDLAPDFTISAVTNGGASRAPVTLSQLRGSTVVIAFFYKARTKG